MRIIPVLDAGAGPDAVGRAERAVARLTTLADVLAWGRAQAPPAPVAEIVTQDEYTHDVVVPLGARDYLSFDTT
jgi:hypothetical protein